MQKEVHQKVLNSKAIQLGNELPSWADKFIPVATVSELTNLGITSVWNKARDGEFTPYRISANRTAFSFREVQDWIAERKQSGQVAA